MAKEKPERPLRVLVVEDSEDDALLMMREIVRSGFAADSTRVDSAAALTAALGEEDWDIVLSDYSMPSFDGLSALSLIRQRDLELPFVVVSRAIGEEQAVGLMRAGAHDFVSKSNLARLGPVVQREVREAETRRKHRQAQLALWESERRHRTLLESLPVGVFRATPEGRILAANPCLVEMLGHSSEDEIARTRWIDLMASATQTRALVEIAEHGEETAELEVKVRRRDGSTFWGLIRVRPCTGPDGTIDHVDGTLTDTTHRHELEHALTQGKEEWERTFDAVRELILITDSLLEVVHVNQAVADRLGARPQELVGRSWGEVVGRPSPPVDLPGLLEAGTGGGSIDFDLKSERLGGEFRFSVTPRLDQDGVVVGAIHVGRDVTTQRQIEELLRRQATVDQAEHIFRTFRHEAGNALNTLKTTLSVFRTSFERFTRDQRETYFARCFDSLRIAEQLLAALRSYQTLDHCTLRRLELRAFLREKRDLLFAAAVQRGVYCQLVPGETSVEVLADPDALVRILLNLIENAVGATAGEPDSRISVSCHLLGGQAVLEVADNGAGIPHDIMPQIFSPLFTTKSEGSGMGLAIVQKLMLRMNGLAMVHSEVGRGAVFELRFPLSASDPDHDP